MMRKGDLGEHPVRDVLRAAASEGLGGGIAALPGPPGPAGESLIAAARRADGRPPLRPVGATGVESH